MKIDCKENYLAEGLVHKIYKFDENIYKVPKDEFQDFNNLEHFFVERVSHEILRETSLPAVEVLNIYEKGELIEDKCVLEERFIPGDVIDNPNLNSNERKKIILNMLAVNKIKIHGFGRINTNGRANFSKWYDYIENSIEEVSTILENCREENLEIYLKYLASEIRRVPLISEGFFLTLDTNSNNYIFNNNQEIIAMIDVDHPISGDKLYEYAALKFHHPKNFQILESKYVDFNKSELDLLKYYFIHFGISTITFELLHNLDIGKSLRSLENVQL